MGAPVCWAGRCVTAAWPGWRQVLGGQAPKACAGIALQPAQRKSHQHAGGHLGIHGGCGRACGVCGRAQALAQGQLYAIKKPVHALLQALVLQHQRVARHQARQPGVALTKLQHQRHHARGLPGAHVSALFGRGQLAAHHLLHQREHGLLDEVDQRLVHLRLAGKVPVQRGLAHRQARSQRSRGDALGPGLLQHGGQRLQNLRAPFSRLGALAGDGGGLGAGSGFGGFGGGFELGHGCKKCVQMILAQPSGTPQYRCAAGKCLLLSGVFCYFIDSCLRPTGGRLRQF